MTLKECIKQLRENQKRKRNNPLAKNDLLPTRNSKITHMFQHFFLQKRGCGALRMMVCINPKPADFDENIRVMEFAEMTQKIQIERVEAIPKNVFTAGKNYFSDRVFFITVHIHHNRLFIATRYLEYFSNKFTIF